MDIVYIHKSIYVYTDYDAYLTFNDEQTEQKII